MEILSILMVAVTVTACKVCCPAGAAASRASSAAVAAWARPNTKKVAKATGWGGCAGVREDGFMTINVNKNNSH